MKKLLLLFAALCCTAMMQAEIVHHAKCDPTYTTVGYAQECWEDTGTGKLYAEQGCATELNRAMVVTYKKLRKDPVVNLEYWSNQYFPLGFDNYVNISQNESETLGDCPFYWNAKVEYTQFGTEADVFGAAKFKALGTDIANARLKCFWNSYSTGVSATGGDDRCYRLTIKIGDQVVYEKNKESRWADMPHVFEVPLPGLKTDDVVTFEVCKGAQYLYGGDFAASLEYTSSNGGDPDAAAIKTDDKRKFKGTDDPELTYTVAPISLAENVSEINLSRDAGEEPGFYTIHASQTEGANPDRDIFFYDDGKLEIVDGAHHAKDETRSDGLIYLQDCWEETATGKYYADDYLEHELKPIEAIGYIKLPSNPITATDGFTVKESATYDGVPFNWAAETTYGQGENGTRTVDFIVTEPNIYNNARLVWYSSTNSGMKYGLRDYTIKINGIVVYSDKQSYAAWVDSGLFFAPLPNVKVGDKITFEYNWTSGYNTPTVAACLQYTCPSELYFMAQEAGSTVQLKKNGTPYDASLEYSTTGTTWQPYTYGQTITLANEGDRVYFRNASDDLAEGFSKGYMSDYYQFAMTSSIAAGGNVMSLLDKTCKSTAFPDDDGNVETPEDFYYFVNLFSGCTSLTSAPELPATKLTPYCYMSMFNGCTGLTEAPALPATTLSDWCYNVMFEGCTGLEQAPALPATTMESNCYAAMFKGCTGLTEAPELPAMTMKDGCYYEMFSGCTSLETAPALPSTTLALQCYKKMFEGCTSLTAAPELPATTLAKECYGNMFNGCTSLTAAPELSATILAPFCFEKMFYGCTKLNQVKVGFTNWGDMGDSYAGDYRATSDWLSGVASTGIFVCPDALDKTKIGTSYIPEGWSVNGYNITVSSVGWASMYLPMAVTIPDGVKAYYAASVSDNVVTLNALTDAIPACTGVIVKAAAGTVTFPYTATAVTPIEGNLFEGVTCATPCDANANYVLNTSKCTADSPCFSNYTGTSLGAFKAYMPKSAVGGTGSIQFRFGDTTAITPAETEVAEDVVYNLAGQRVSSDYRGIVIKNGKKMYIN